MKQVFLASLFGAALLLTSGIVEVAFALRFKTTAPRDADDGHSAVRRLLYPLFPLDAAIANSVLIFLSFLLMVIGLITPTRKMLKATIVSTAISALFTLCIGVAVWVTTLTMRSRFRDQWADQPFVNQSLMQTSFSCCGFANSTSPPFVTDSVCPSPASAALSPGCSAAVTTYANSFVGKIFTALFGIVGADVVVILAILCFLKERKEEARYRHIDAKQGF